MTRTSLVISVLCTIMVPGNTNKKAQLTLTNPREANACRKLLLQFDVQTSCNPALVWRPIAIDSRWTPCNINVIYTPLKSAFNELQFRRWQYGYIFIRLAVIDTETWEMSRNSKRLWPYSSSRSSKIIDLGVNGKFICDVLLVVNCNVSLSATVFEIFTLRDRKRKDRKLLILPPFPCFTHQLGVTPFEFCDEIGNQKTRIVGLPDGEEIMTFLRLTQYRRVRDRQTDRRVAVTKTRASITSRGQKKSALQPERSLQERKTQWVLETTWRCGVVPMAWPLVLAEIHGDEDQSVLIRTIGLSAETES